METWHRVAINPRRDVGFQEALDQMGVKYKIAPLPGYPVGLIFFDIAESDIYWPKVDELIRTIGASNVFDTLFTTEEILAADWVRLYPALQRGYPQPRRGWERATHKNECPRCGAGYRQKSPFRLAGEPRMGKHDFLSLHWTWAVFCTSRVVEALATNKIRGCEVWPAIINRTNQPSAVVSQLIFPHVAGPGLAGEDRLKSETCSQCGMTKYEYHKRGYMHLRRDSLRTDVDTQLTYEWFGSGGMGFREILWSHRLVKLILEAGWRGLRFKPVKLV